ncbi:MAG: cytochrome C [Bacteroidota bacterium]|nr:cytochrome C [Bacteroidota bacterium]
MKTALKWIGILMILIVVLIGAGFTYFTLNFPNVDPAPEMVVEVTPERVERGKYLAHHVMMCMECHSEKDYSKFLFPVKPGTEGAGGQDFGPELGLPGHVVSKNLTPYHLGDWTDGEIYRAITAGVSKDGHALFPIMPWPNFGKCDPEDIKSVIAYLRTLEPVEKDNPPTELDFPMNFIVKTMPQNPTPGKRPSPHDRLEYGKYMVTAAGCGDCHNKEDKGQLVGMPFEGGREFSDGHIMMRSANITPDPTYGIGMLSEDEFLGLFRRYSTEMTDSLILKNGDFTSIMPWCHYRGMEDDDIRAIHTYLRTIEPSKNEVTTFEVLAQN